MDRHAKPKTFCKQNMTQYFFALCKSRLQRYHIGQEQGKLSITDPEKACLQACFVCEGSNFGLTVSKGFLGMDVPSMFIFSAMLAEQSMSRSSDITRQCL